MGHRVGGWVIHFPLVVCTSSPNRVESLAERTERTLLRALRANPGHQQIRRLHIRQPTPLLREHLSHQAGCAVVVTRSVTVSDQLIRRTCDALTSQRRQVSVILAVSARDRRTSQQHDTDYGDAGKHKQTVRLDPAMRRPRTGDEHIGPRPESG